ncbi:MAG: type II toxin-antitoxin system RelE/ParE family toxin [Halothiobacillaceae bacterium]
MLPILWRQSARLDLLQIVRFIAQENPQAARRLKNLLESAILPVAEHPYLYRVSERIPGAREIVAHPNYIVLYRVTTHSIEVINIIHARREFP